MANAKPGIKKKTLILPAVLAICLLLALLFGVNYFSGYLQGQIYVERTTQLNEITTQVRANLDSALNTHWNYLNTAVNALETERFPTADSLIEHIGDLEELLGTERYNSMLMLLDSRGNCYDAGGRHGVWSDISQISGGEDQYAFISNTDIYEGSYWAFVRELERPLEASEEGITFTHAVLLKDIYTLTEYYDSSAYGSQNETYILKTNGTRMHDDIGGEKTIQAYNVIKVLEEMEGQSYPDIRAALQETDIISANFFHDGGEYYYCLASLPAYDTLLLFLIPAEYVATGTVSMVNTIIQTLLLLAVLLILLLIAVVVAVARQQNSARLFRQEQENLHQQEALNEQLAQSKAAAEEAFKVAEEANRAKSAFLSNMSHDIRTPMNAIVGFAALLSRDAESPDKVREYTRKITGSSQHLLGLINDILDISKIEAGKTTLNLSDESLTEFVGNIDAIIRPQMKEKGHTFEVYNIDLKHEQLVMDKLRLNQILLNLLSNAVKYTPEGGLVTLTVQELPQHNRQLARFRFIVADNGYGMSEDYQKKVFQAFTREEDSTTNKIQGTGLGMAITKNLIDLMGGTIRLESEKGKGSTFTVELNLHVSEQETDVGFWQKQGITRLLVVDDEDVVCQNVKLAMEGTGVEVEYTLGGRTAVEMVKQSDEKGRLYDIVLLDWKMPGMDGVETARRIRQEIPGGGPIIILNSYDWPEIEEEALAAGVDGFLSKPFFLTSFRQKMDSVLGREQTAAAESEADVDVEEGILNGMHILVAEDNEINAEILTELLDMEGASCEICENGQELVEAFEKSAPGQYPVILCDIQMPVMNGYDATRAIRRLEHPQARTIPIIAMTANAFAEDVRDALDAGMNAHVAKPIDMTLLKLAVKSVVAGPAGRANSRLDCAD